MKIERHETSLKDHDLKAMVIETLTNGKGEVIENTRSRVKKITKLTKFIK